MVETAYLAGRTALAYYQTGLQPVFKPDDTPVTVADRQAEALIRGRIEERWPGHAILGEEYGVSDTGQASHRWIIDPIDGTKSFLQGVPLFAVLIGLEIEGVVRAGCAYFPALDEMLAAAESMGCWWNGRRAHVSQQTDLSRAVVAYTSQSNFPRAGRQAAWERIQAATYLRRGWGDAYGYLLVATGRADLMLDPLMNPWDAGPFPAILSEAGGYFGDWSGNSTIYAGEALATTTTLLPSVLALLRSDKPKRKSPRPGT
jgi:myo-inositol-1(or 4)-monophosphatase